MLFYDYKQDRAYRPSFLMSTQANRGVFLYVKLWGYVVYKVEKS